MRSRRLSFLLLAFYFIFLGGSAYYTLIFPVRFFHHAFVTVLAAVWYYRRWRRDGLPQSPLNLPLYAAVVMWFITAATSIDSRMAIENLWFVLLHVTIFFVLVDLIQCGRQRLIMEAQFLLAALVVIVTGLELASWYFGLGIVPGTDVGWLTVIGPGAWLPLEIRRVSLAMNISTLLAGYVAPLIPLVIAWALTAKQKDFRQVLWMLAVALSVTLILTFSRGGILSVMGAFGAWGLMRIVQQPAVIRRVNSAILVGGAVAVIVIAVGVLLLSQTRSSGDRVRVDMYESALEILQEKPAFGVGTGEYGRAFRDYRTASLARDRLASAHNAYLNTAAETGILGIVISAWLGVILLIAWRNNWKYQTSTARRLRLEAALAGLIGVGVHSVVDVFTTTPIVSVIALLAAYSVVGHRTVLDKRPQGNKLAAGVALLITIGYGIFFVQVDRAQIQYQRSLGGGDDAIQSAQNADAIDPNLNLYTLQIAHLRGEQALDNPTEGNIQLAIDAYQTALEREPTWDTGWINLAALTARTGDLDTALDYLETARAINPLTIVPLDIARIADEAEIGEDDDIIADYIAGMSRTLFDDNRLPLSIFWTETPLRREALTQYAESLPVDLQYRIWRVHDPERLESLVPQSPQTAAEYWVAGEDALTAENDLESAATFFSEAIKRDKRNGDYYAARARATLISDPEMAQRDLDLAELLGTRFEHPNVIRIEFTESQDEIDTLLARALPGRTIKQEFAAVLYGGRAADFDFFPEMRAPGPGRAAMQPWYTLARQHTLNGRIDSARNVYHVILAYAPDETEARELLNALGD